MTIQNVLSAERPPFPAKMLINIYQEPAPLEASHQTYLIYEIYISNLMSSPLVLKELKVISHTKQFQFSGSALTQLIQPIDPKNIKNPLTLSPGESRILFLWLVFHKNEFFPNQLIHEFTMNGMIHNTHYIFHEKSFPVAIKKTAPFVIGAPLKGNNWLAGNAPANGANHRGENFIFAGKPFYSQRYAIDFVRFGTDGLSYKGDESKNKNYYAYDQDALAVGDGKVIFIQDGIAENIPNSNKFSVAMNLKTLPGNYLILDLGSGKFAGYAHLIPGSFKVKVGDFVKKGQVIAKIGNSGNSSEPHLHFQIMDHPDFYKANGVPYVFERFTTLPIEVVSKPNEIFKIRILKAKKETYINQMVLENTFMSF